MKKSSRLMIALIPLLAGFIATAPLSQLHARGDRGSNRTIAANEGHHEGGRGEDHNHQGEGYHNGYEHGYEHGYDHGYNHGYNRGDYYGEPGFGVGVGVGLGIGGVGLGGDVYTEPVQPVYYTPEPGVNIHIGN